MILPGWAWLDSSWVQITRMSDSCGDSTLPRYTRILYTYTRHMLPWKVMLRMAHIKAEVGVQNSCVVKGYEMVSSALLRTDG